MTLNPNKTKQNFIKQRLYKIFLSKKSVSAVLILSFLILPLGEASKARAQNINAYTAGLLPAIARLPQCQELAGKATRKLFKGIGNLFGGNDIIPGDIDATEIAFLQETEGLSYEEARDKLESAKAAQTLDQAASEASAQLDGVQVYDPEGNKKLDTILEKSEKIEKSTASLNENSKCYQSIGRLMIKMLLQKLTISTVNWINSGFDGSPAFIQDPGKFFGDIAKNEVLQFGLEINDPELFPFGKAWMRNTALAFNQKFQDNARYSLNEMIQSTSPSFSVETFHQSFAQGGWNAWTAMTYPQNNPIGFQLMADNELNQRLAGTVQSTAEQVREGLAQAGGFLGDQRCAEPRGTTREQHDQAVKENNKEGTCKRWEYVTPGLLISEAATTAMNYQNNAYLNVEDLNDAVAAVLDSLLARFSYDIMESGFANLGQEGIDGALAFDYSSLGNPYQAQAEKDFAPIHLGTSWLQANPNFNIRTDLNQALIDEQRTYSDKLLAQNTELLSTTDGLEYRMSDNGTSNAWGLIPAIYQLDYCIPGPHPGWYEDSENALRAATNEIIPETADSLKNIPNETIAAITSSIGPLAAVAVAGSIIATGGILGAQIGTAFLPVVGTVVGSAVGAIIGGIVSLFKKKKRDNGGEKVRLYYSSIIQGLTGIESDYKDGNSIASQNLMSKQGTTQVLYEILRRYGNRINKFFDSNLLPSVHVESAANYYQLDGYGKMIDNNENRVALLKTTINTLNDVKNDVDELNAELESGQISNDQYEEELKAPINAFGRLSSNMVNGDDIAEADNLLKQIIDKRVYIYENLLKGPYGCEAELANTQLSKQVQNTKRMSYPFPIIYDYNKETKGEVLPDPWGNNQYSNEMTFNTDTNSVGPGFLSYVFFEAGLNNREVAGYDLGFWASDNYGQLGKEGYWYAGGDDDQGGDNSGTRYGRWIATSGTGGTEVASFETTNDAQTEGTWTGPSGSGTWSSQSSGPVENKGLWEHGDEVPFNVVYQETFCREGTYTSELPKELCMIQLQGLLPLFRTQSSPGRAPEVREPVRSMGGKNLQPSYIDEIKKPWANGMFEAIIGIY